MFIPRLDEYSYPTDEDYQHFQGCKIRIRGKLNECKRCKYVWDHWYGTFFPYNIRIDNEKEEKLNRNKNGILFDIITKPLLLSNASSCILIQYHQIS
jgi:hypothetical protein